MSMAASMPILVVDDYNTMLRIVRNLLRQLGFKHVDEASDAKTALAKMRTRNYGLVISDWNMRPMSGFDLVREVRADEKLKDTPVIMLTPAEGNNSVPRDASVNSYLPKPFDALALKRRLMSVLGVEF
ncbi:MAG: response regulator [Hyphomonadaceae bacterium]|nr:response regulator [Hyphomonadaceae bacterium]